MVIHFFNNFYQYMYPLSVTHNNPECEKIANTFRMCLFSDKIDNKDCKDVFIKVEKLKCIKQCNNCVQINKN